MPKNKAINLLPQEEFNVSTTGRVLKWTTGTFRIIVIVTEMIVMGAFLSRFWLDAQNSNLNNSIKAKSAQISAQVELEKQFRGIQSKLTIFDQIQKNNNTSKLIEKITSAVPLSVTLTRLSFSETSIEVRGVSLSDADISQFIANLQAKDFKKVELGQVGSSQTDAAVTVFVLNITY